ncbi:uncharacterized protein N7500_008872 [Penicillium coprophilum]|uniref:uncharacterized protein n=1 Tax=Penicillium coprophilum TaxID=36646 RepID=UPI0023995476|nr:uncharacterized protein N7500_008872 [Penicillium coprophilum]KAJ5159221.1 hypothetical protein N7500_008872 [Penicillium coprophilum]
MTIQQPEPSDRQSCSGIIPAHGDFSSERGAAYPMEEETLKAVVCYGGNTGSSIHIRQPFLERPAGHNSASTFRGEKDGANFVDKSLRTPQECPIVETLLYKIGYPFSQI